jgi:MFS family permease
MVVLDASIVNVALPHIQRALGFSGSGLEWVVNAYALTFGGLMLLGGRAGDLFGRRKVFIAGLLLFSAASLAGGLATSQAWLLAARAVQGAGGALTAPAALSLISTTFPEGRPRNRAMGVYAAMSVAGGAIGLIAGGLLTTYASWRWVLFVNVPIGLVTAAAAPRVLRESARQPGRFDLPGAITGTGGIAALVYGLSEAAASPDGVSHWSDAKVVASLAVSRVGARPLLLAGTLTTADGLYWLSRASEHSSYTGGLLGPTLVISAGLGLLFVPVTLVAMSRVADAESGVAASLRNTAQQVGGSIGLAVLGTAAWTVVANSVRSQAAHAAAATARAGHPARPGRAALTAIYHHALSTGFSRAFLVTAGIMLVALIVTIATIRVRRADLGVARP